MNFFPTGPKSIWIMGKQCVRSQDKTSNKQVMLFILFIFWSRVSVPHMQHSRKNKEQICEHAFPQSHTLSLKISWLEVIAVPKRGVWISLPDLLLLGGRRGGTVAEHWQRLIRADERNQRLRWWERRERMQVSPAGCGGPHQRARCAWLMQPDSKLHYMPAHD